MGQVISVVRRDRSAKFLHGRSLTCRRFVAANFSSDVTGVRLPLDSDWADASVVLTNLAGDAPLRPPPDLKLRPWESVVWRRGLR